MDPHFEYRIADRSMVTNVTKLGRTKPGQDSGLSDRITKGLQPRVKLGGPKKDTHRLTYPYGYTCQDMRSG
jgi:hypothetical protein